MILKEWLKISCLLCVFGFFREIRPSEPFITEFLTGPWRNITEEQVNRDVIPIGTYCHAVQLIIVFIITDFLRYKPLIIVIGISGIIVWSLLIWTTSLLALQIVEFFYGTYMAAEVAYYTYIYAKVDKKYYDKVTSHTRAAMLAGKLVGSISSQILINFKLMDYKELNYVTLATQIFATCWALFLPKVGISLYFHRKIDSPTDFIETNDDINVKKELQQQQNYENLQSTTKLYTKRTLTAFQLLWSHFVNAYTNLKVIQWSLWYAAGFCGQLQVMNYIQLLWKGIEKNPPTAWNAGVDAVLTFLGTIFALLAGYLQKLEIGLSGSLLLLSILSIFEGLSILLSAWTNTLYISYIGYIIFCTLYAFTITVVSAKVAFYLEEDNFGLVFGINTLAALLIETILTLIVISNDGLGLNIIQQYTVYAFYFIVIGIIYLANVIFEYFCK